MPSRGFHLWLALPPEHELGPVESIYQAPEQIERDGPASVLLGSHGSATSALNGPSPLNYLAVRLKAGERWRYQPPAGHTVGWVALGKGSVLTPERIETGEMAVFEPSEDGIEFVAESDAEFVLGSAVPATHDLVLGTYSVHTSAESLRAGERRIIEVRHQLQREGRL